MKYVRLFEDFDSKGIKIKDLLEDIVALDYILSDEGIKAKYYVTEKMASDSPNRYMIGTSDDISSKIDESWNETAAYKLQVYFDSNTFSQKEIADEYYNQLKEHLESVYDVHVVKDRPYTTGKINRDGDYGLVQENCVSIIIERQPDDYKYFPEEDAND